MKAWIVERVLSLTRATWSRRISWVLRGAYEDGVLDTSQLQELQSRFGLTQRGDQ